MSQTLIHMEGMLEPLVLNCDFQATFQNLSAALRNNSTFFMSQDGEGEMVGVHIPRIIYIKQVD